MSSKHSSSVGFLGIFILLGAALAANSAPYRDFDQEDEEGIIDRLASLGSPDLYLGSNKPLYTDFDLDSSQVDYLHGLAQDEVIAKAALANLPRQFAYKPSDVRFYLPDSAFPDPEEMRNERGNESPDLDVQQNLPTSGEEKDSVNEERNSPPNFQPMKKSQRGGESDFHPVPIQNNIQSSAHGVEQSDSVARALGENGSFEVYKLALVAACGAASVVAIIAAGICWYKIHERIKATADVDYPAYGVTGPSKDVSPSGGDRKLAQSAHMYHYQHQKQQMAALQKTNVAGEQQEGGASDVESEDDNDEEGDYTVYECPGLAPAGEMEVKNPLFADEPTPATPNMGRKTPEAPTVEIEEPEASNTSKAASKEHN